MDTFAAVEANKFSRGVGEILRLSQGAANPSCEALREGGQARPEYVPFFPPKLADSPWSPQDTARKSSGRRETTPAPQLCQNQLPDCGPAGVIIPTIHRSRRGCRNLGKLRGRRRDPHEPSSRGGSLCFKLNGNGFQGGSIPELSLVATCPGSGQLTARNGRSRQTQPGSSASTCLCPAGGVRGPLEGRRLLRPLSGVRSSIEQLPQQTTRAFRQQTTAGRPGNVGITNAVDCRGAESTKPTTPTSP